MDLVMAMGIRLYNTMMEVMFSIFNGTGISTRLCITISGGGKGWVNI